MGERQVPGRGRRCRTPARAGRRRPVRRSPHRHAVRRRGRARLGGERVVPLRSLRPADVGWAAGRGDDAGPMSIRTVAPFDVCGPLPTGVAVLEASAGTGKTFTIAALATRYVAEGLPFEHLLIVTFTRMATSELRDRVRERMVSAEQGLSRALLGVAPDAGDDVLRLLANGPGDEVRRR